jgi:DNA replication protein DnaC
VDDKGWFVRALASIVDARYAACLKTIMTTNLNAERFKATYGERIADRIRESGRFRDVAGQSVRR